MITDRKLTTYTCPGCGTASYLMGYCGTCKRTNVALTASWHRKAWDELPRVDMGVSEFDPSLSTPQRVFLTLLGVAFSFILFGMTYFAVRELPQLFARWVR